MWSIYTTGFYSAVKKNEIMKISVKWTEVENIKMNIVTGKVKSGMFSYFNFF